MDDILILLHFFIIVFMVVCMMCLFDFVEELLNLLCILFFITFPMFKEVCSLLFSAVSLEACDKFFFREKLISIRITVSEDLLTGWTL